MTAPYETPLWLQAKTGDPAVTYPAQADRALLDVLVPVAGVATPGAWLVAQRAAGANLSVDVAAGVGFVAGTSVVEQGKYLCRTSGVANVTVAGPPATGYRYDQIVAKVTDPQADGTTTYGFSMISIAGADNAGTLAALPANSLLLALVYVAAGAASVTTANLTDKRVGAQSLTAAAPTWQSITNIAAGFTAGSPAPQCRLWANGLVECRGMIQSTSTFGGGGVTIATLPAGFAPNNTRWGAALHNYFTAGTANNASDCRLEAASNGNIADYCPPGVVTWSALDNLSFYLT